jgi:hypothetical protein
MGVMKSFHRYSETPMTPERCVSDYRPEELSRFQEAFKPQAERFRRNQQTANIVLGVAFLSALAGVMFSMAFVPGVVLEKIVVNLSGVKPSYLGPPESYHNGMDQNRPARAN